MKGILLFGGGGHCRSVIDSLVACKNFDRIGIIERPGVEINCPAGTFVGTSSDLEKLYSEGFIYGFVTVGSIGNTEIRQKLAKELKKNHLTPVNIIDPSASISNTAVLGQGIFIGKNAVINYGVHIEDYAIINTGAIIEHDCLLGEFTHISPGAVLCGGVSVGRCSHIGACSCVKQCINVGSGCLVGMGSVVTKDLDDGVTAYGNPCKVVSKDE